MRGWTFGSFGVVSHSKLTESLFMNVFIDMFKPIVGRKLKRVVIDLSDRGEWLSYPCPVEGLCVYKYGMFELE